MIIDYSYSTLQQFPGYLGLGNVWTFNGTVAAVIVGPDHNETGIGFVPQTARLEFVPQNAKLEFIPGYEP